MEKERGEGGTHREVAMTVRSRPNPVVFNGVPTAVVGNTSLGKLI
jgi:hypothetical protein